jgi:hypothetical protein
MYISLFVGALHCNAPYEVSVPNRGFVGRSGYNFDRGFNFLRIN